MLDNNELILSIPKRAELLSICLDFESKIKAMLYINLIGVKFKDNKKIPLFSPAHIDRIEIDNHRQAINLTIKRLNKCLIKSDEQYILNPEKCKDIIYEMNFSTMKLFFDVIRDSFLKLFIKSKKTTFQRNTNRLHRVRNKLAHVNEIELKIGNPELNPTGRYKTYFDLKEGIELNAKNVLQNLI